MPKLLNERAANYDLLRCLCVWAVIINHVSDVTLFWEGSGQVISYIFVLFGPFLMKMKSADFCCKRQHFSQSVIKQEVCMGTVADIFLFGGGEYGGWRRE